MASKFNHRPVGITYIDLSGRQGLIGTILYTTRRMSYFHHITSHNFVDQNYLYTYMMNHLNMQRNKCLPLVVCSPYVDVLFPLYVCFRLNVCFPCFSVSVFFLTTTFVLFYKFVCTHKRLIDGASQMTLYVSIN